MANTAKKATSADVKNTAVKASEKPSEVKAAETKAETAAPKAEKKTEAKKPGRKPAAKKETAAKAEKKPAAKAAKKETVKKETAKTEKKPAASKSEKKTETAAKPAAKRGRKPAAKAEEKAAPAKRGSKKKQLSYEEIVDAARKKALAANVTKIKFQIAANIVLTGDFSENVNAAEDKNKNQFYIVVDPETENVFVEPYRYDNNNVEITADAEELMKVLKGKKNIYDALSDGEVHIHGITKQAVLFIHSVL